MLLQVSTAWLLHLELYEMCPPTTFCWVLHYETQTPKLPLQRKKLLTSTFGNSFQMFPHPLAYQKSTFCGPPCILKGGPVLQMQVMWPLQIQSAHCLKSSNVLSCANSWIAKTLLIIHSLSLDQKTDWWHISVQLKVDDAQVLHCSLSSSHKFQLNGWSAHWAVLCNPLALGQVYKHKLFHEFMYLFKFVIACFSKWLATSLNSSHKFQLNSWSMYWALLCNPQAFGWVYLHEYFHNIM